MLYVHFGIRDSDVSGMLSEENASLFPTRGMTSGSDDQDNL
jgi:hypothetical protein